jgi:phospholipid/cholesterol/gamma-HCH transport system ATP-binding protein
MPTAESRPQTEAQAPTQPPAVAFEHVALAFDDDVILRDVSFSIPVGGLTVLLGASGSGKSLILKMIMGLVRPDSGTIHVNGQRTDNMPEAELMKLRPDIGMLFQEGALFDSLTVAENVGYRLIEEEGMPLDEARRRVEKVLGFIGLAEYLDRFPSELSGGQRRRVAIGRAVASNPRLVLFDSPTTGLDPITAKTVDREVMKLRDLQHVTSFLVTHDLHDAFYIAAHRAVQQNGEVQILPATEDTADDARFMVLKDGRIYFEGSAEDLKASTDPYLKRYLKD